MDVTAKLQKKMTAAAAMHGLEAPVVVSASAVMTDAAVWPREYKFEATMRDGGVDWISQFTFRPIGGVRKSQVARVLDGEEAVFLHRHGKLMDEAGDMAKKPKPMRIETYPYAEMKATMAFQSVEKGPSGSTEQKPTNPGDAI